MSTDLIRYLATPDEARPDSKIAHNEAKDVFEVLVVRVDKVTGKSDVFSYADVDLEGLANLHVHNAENDNCFVLKMVCVPLVNTGDRFVLDLNEGTFRSVLHLLQLQDQYALAHTNGMTFDVLPHTEGSPATLVYSFFISYYICLYFRHTNDQSACGLLWSHQGADAKRGQNFERFKLALKTFKHLARNPAYGLFVLLTVLFRATSNRMSRMREQLLKIEAHTGYQDWGQSRLTYGLPSTAVEVHLDKYIAELTGMASVNASDKRATYMMQRILQVIKDLDHQSADTTSRSYPSIPVCNLVLLDNRAPTQLIQCEVLEARICSQITAVQNLKARHEMRLSITLAHESKNLALSMKVLAILTVVFLPATFVASLFSTTMFNWHISDSQLVSEQFWIYWVIAIPLTAVTVSSYVWLISRRHQQVRSRSEAEEGEELAVLTSRPSHL